MSTTISGSLIHQVRLLYQVSLDNWFLKRDTLRQDISIFTDSALPSFVLCVASIEALLNETFIGGLSHHHISTSTPFNLMEQSALEKMEIDQKLLLFPYLAFGKTLDKSTQPFQDFKMLVRLRNEIVHYKMKSGTPSFVQPLIDRKIAFKHTHPVSVGENSKFITIWIHDVSTSEAIRWGHNTVCEVVNEIYKLIPEGPAYKMFSHSASNFQLIEKEAILDIFKKNGIDV
jgi:hypothetical protein